MTVGAVSCTLATTLRERDGELVASLNSIDSHGGRSSNR